jgi:hypothetical protein
MVICDEDGEGRAGAGRLGPARRLAQQHRKRTHALGFISINSIVILTISVFLSFTVRKYEGTHVHPLLRTTRLESPYPCLH